jgi:lysyl-tRNA synthetase class I
MLKQFTIGRWDIEIGRALQPWTHFKLHRRENGRHLVWGRLSIVVADGTAPVHPVCAQCGSIEAHEVGHGDEGWTVCPDCGSIEGGYRYVSKRELEAA